MKTVKFAASGQAIDIASQLSGITLPNNQAGATRTWVEIEEIVDKSVVTL